jgi:hypothetical protein
LLSNVESYTGARRDASARLLDAPRRAEFNR